MQITKVTSAGNVTLYAQWERIPVKVDICSGNTGAFSNKNFWTNSTGNTVIVYYTISCIDYFDESVGSGAEFKIGVNQNWVASVRYGKTINGTLSVPNGSSVWVNSYYAWGPINLYYYN